MKLIESFVTYLMAEEKTKNTVYNYKLAIQEYASWFIDIFDKEPTALYSQNVKDYLQYLQLVKKRSAKTINVKLAALQKYNEFLIAMGVQNELVISKNMKKKIQQDYASPAQFSEKEVHKFLQAIVETKKVRDYALVILLMHTGCRISEALHIDLQQDLYLSSSELVIRSGKGDKQRTVLLNQKVIQAVKNYLVERNVHKYKKSPYLFVSNKGPKLSRMTVNDMFTKYSKLAGLEIFLKPHDLRHYFCSHALENGFDVHEVAHIAGHSNIHTTLLYTNPSRTKMLDKLNLL
ncbi:tyrosine-type recombinase/integrase [Bacillus thuringiensis]|uniref:tyrosine-type recombinase/integrase n=1 Tax=Bacillus thuringiensis TaxID=1428 RepID=UPI001FAE3B79|nr:tyrosine-type recombinase/integrase [Bacillus thuringiensis]MDM8365490.1 tyrosine-type recombinase/integrase [Bacillus thuringiensis]